jgi:anthraniloyl-CoA monooxygenase
VVLMGDAVHTAHFAIGSGTKLAIEDAIELTRQFKELGDAPAKIPEVLARYQALRRVDVLRLQNAAWNAMEWFEVCGQRYCDQLEPEQFMYSMLTRSQRISHENLRLRDKAWLEGFERWFAARAERAAAGPPQGGAAPSGGGEDRGSAATAAWGPVPPPMFTPFHVRGLTLKNRVVVSPMAQYRCVDGVPGDYHLVHLGARAAGGAAMVVVEMTCPSADARITPGCPGLWNDTQQAAWARIVDYVHRETDAKIAVQIGHAGPKGSTNAPWEHTGADRPLPAGNWPLISASALPYLDDGAVPRAMDRADMERVRDDFVAATRRAAAAGFDWLELHCAHGYLLASFLSPLTNTRSDAYGGSVQNRLRYPLEVFDAIRAVWPADKPMSVRISATDWKDGGISDEDTLAIARAFAAAGADLIDVSTGQTVHDAAPMFGRMYQVPWADMIRNEAGIATMCVGNISNADQANTILAAGRADLVAFARLHLTEPSFAQRAAAIYGVKDTPCPVQYFAGKDALLRNTAREMAELMELKRKAKPKSHAVPAPRARDAAE